MKRSSGDSDRPALSLEVGRSVLGRLGRAPAIAWGFAMVLFGAGVAPGWSQAAPVYRVVVASAEPCLSLHSEPDSKSAPVRCLAPGRRMNLLESLDGWARVRLADAQEGWVPFRLVRPAAGSSAGAEVAGSLASRQIAILESALAAAAVERAELRRGTSALRAEIYELRLANERMMAAEAEAEAKAQQIGELETALADSNSLLREERALRERAEAEAGRRVEALATLEAALALAEAGRAELEQEASELRRELDQLRVANERLASRLPQPMLGSRLELLEEALGLIEGERLNLAQENFAYRNEVERLRELNEALVVGAVERPESVTVAPAIRREFQGAREPAGSPAPSGGMSAEPAELAEQSGPNAQLPAKEASRTATPTELLPKAKDATAAVEAWARAWSEQRVEDYLYFYSTAFEPPDASSREEWEALRRERIARPERIDVRIALADLRPLENDRLAVVFLQSYESDLMTDVVLKTLEMVREQGDWKIAAERIE